MLFRTGLNIIAGYEFSVVIVVSGYQYFKLLKLNRSQLDIVFDSSGNYLNVIVYFYNSVQAHNFILSLKQRIDAK